MEGIECVGIFIYIVLFLIFSVFFVVAPCRKGRKCYSRTGNATFNSSVTNTVYLRNVIILAATTNHSNPKRKTCKYWIILGILLAITVRQLYVVLKIPKPKQLTKWQEFAKQKVSHFSVCSL